MLKNILSIFLFLAFVGLVKSDISNITGVCYNLKDKDSCNNNQDCSWCRDAGYKDLYSCYNKIDDCDCVGQVRYNNCVGIDKCHYCNLGPYAGRYCISKNVQCG